MRKLARILAAVLVAFALRAEAAPPNYAYISGTTPSTGGLAAIQVAINSLLLGVSTTVTSGSISLSGSPQVVTVASATNIGVGTALWVNWGAADQEPVSLTVVAGNNITAIFTKNHLASATIGVGIAYQTGATNPWAKPTFQTGSLTAYLSTIATATGDASFVPILLGLGASANQFGFATADDIDNSGTNSAPRNVANFNGTNITNIIQVQDASFAWWMNLCEFGLVGVVDVAGTYRGWSVGALKTPFPITQRGVGNSIAIINSAATSVTVSPDISSRITGGSLQNVYIINQSHSSSSTNWAAAPVVMTVSSVTGTGSQATLNFTGGTAHAFDSGAEVGLVPPLYSVGGAVSVLDMSSGFLATHFLDGTYTSQNGQTFSGDSLVITTNTTSYMSPTDSPQAMYAGELDLPVYSSTAVKFGIAGFTYGYQEFVSAGVASQDAFYDNSGPFVWKAFTATNTVGLGPLINAQNTAASPIGWVP